MATGIGGALMLAASALSATDGVTDTNLSLFVLGSVSLVIAVSVFRREYQLERARYRHRRESDNGNLLDKQQSAATRSATDIDHFLDNADGRIGNAISVKPPATEDGEKPG